MGNVVKVNINGLRSYADRIDNVNRRLANVDRALDSLRHTVNVRNANLALSADLIIGRSSTLKRCSEYLRKTASDFEQVENYLASVDPRSFEKPSYDVVTSDDWREKVGRAVKVKVEEVKSFVSDTYNAIKKGISDTCEYIKYSYESGGWVYKTVKIGGQVLQIGLASIEIVSAVGEIAISGGTLSPLAIAQMIDAGNRIVSASANLTNMAMNGNYESDINLLRDVAGGLGQVVGGDFGRSVGEFAYYGFSFFTAATSIYESAEGVVDSVDEFISLSKGKNIKQVFTNACETVKSIANTNVNAETFANLKKITTEGVELRTAYDIYKVFDDGSSVKDATRNYIQSAKRVRSESVRAAQQLIIKGISKLNL